MKLSREFIGDRFALVLAAAGAIFAFINILQTALRVEQRDFDIPVRLSQYGSSPIELGDWFTLYEFAMFTLLTLLVNVWVAARLHKERREISIAVLALNMLIMLFVFIVSNAVLGLSPAS